MRAPDKVWVTDNHDIPTMEFAVSDEKWTHVDSTEYIRADLVPEWQPIETAPKDGTDIIVYDGFVVEVCHFENNVLIVSWSGDRFSRDNAINCDATHWMSLPEGPK